MKKLISNPLIVALDVDTDTEAVKLADNLQDVAGGFKIGPRLVQRYGQTLSLEIARRGSLFIDCKFFDIPSTMESSVRACFESGASLVTVHALSGQEALSRLASVEKELNSIRPFKILCVTILTSFSEEGLPPNLKSQSIKTHVQDLAKLVKRSGLDGVVCSAEELELLQNQNLFLVTPGIRFDLEEKGDQKRTMGPGEAMKKGASALVVGRPIIQAKNPREAAVDYMVAITQKK
ncbi:MAG: orotidine 5'-phosphate decarboxylase [Oligoflexia bacterium]|nr:MAG: orotidine 5'-phosphate decarboxylase [Oligoflexia bacterium]